jgi:opacity protein-like surface antigen
MKNFLIVTSAMVLGSAALVMAQSAPASTTQVMGRGRGGAPYAWNDKNKDGICDLTGKPVGQGPAAGAMRGGRRGRGAGAGWGRGMGRGFGVQQQQTAPAPTQK